MLSGDGKRIAVPSGVFDAGGGVNETSICPVFDPGKCELFSHGGMSGEGWDADMIARDEARLKQRLEEGGFKPTVVVPLQSILLDDDFGPIRVKRRHVRVKSGEWTIDVRGKRRFAIALRSATRAARGVVSCEPGGPGKVTGAVTGAVLARDRERLALWVEVTCAHPGASGGGWERVELKFSPTRSESRPLAR
jgi:hypothetical protein